MTLSRSETCIVPAFVVVVCLTIGYNKIQSRGGLDGI